MGGKVESIKRRVEPIVSISFKSTAEESENDMRFVYCACCISHILQDWSGVDIEKTFDYISKSQVSYYHKL